MDYGRIIEVMKNKKYRVALDRPGCGWEEIIVAQSKENALKRANKKHRFDTAILSDVYEIYGEKVRSLLDAISHQLHSTCRPYLFENIVEEEIMSLNKFLQERKDKGYIKDFAIDEKSSTMNNVIFTITPISANCNFSDKK